MELTNDLLQKIEEAYDKKLAHLLNCTEQNDSEQLNFYYDNPRNYLNDDEEFEDYRYADPSNVYISTKLIDSKFEIDKNEIKHWNGDSWYNDPENEYSTIGTFYFKYKINVYDENIGVHFDDRDQARLLSETESGEIKFEIYFYLNKNFPVINLEVIDIQSSNDEILFYGVPDDSGKSLGDGFCSDDLIDYINENIKKIELS